MKFPIKVRFYENKYTAYPENSFEVSKLIKFCNKKKINLIATGGNTNRVGGTLPNKDCKNIFISFSKMNKIIELDTINMICTVQSGVHLVEVQKKSLKNNLYFPVNIAPNDQCTIGGNISTNVGGLQTLRYGNIEDNINGLEVVLSNGNILNLESKLKKDNFGPKLWKLFCGSEGIFGIITKANLKLIPKKKFKTTYLIEVNSLGKAISIFKKIRGEYYDNLISYEIIFPIPSFITFQSKKFHLILEMSSNDQGNHSKELSQIFDQQKLKVISIENNKLKSNIWKKREELVYNQSKFEFKHKFDISLPLSNWLIFIQKVNIFVKNNIDFTPYFFGHLGDGNLHCNFKIDTENELKKLKLSTFIYNLTIKLNGSIAAEHGIGTQKSELLRKYKSKEYYNFLKELKKQIDPKVILGRGKIL